MAARTKKNKFNRLVEYREKAKLSQSDLAKLINKTTQLGITAPTLSNIENKRSWPRYKTQKIITQALSLALNQDVDIDDLFPLEDDGDSETTPGPPVLEKIPA